MEHISENSYHISPFLSHFISQLKSESNIWANLQSKNFFFFFFYEETNENSVKEFILPGEFIWHSISLKQNMRDICLQFSLLQICLFHLPKLIFSRQSQPNRVSAIICCAYLSHTGGIQNLHQRTQQMDSLSAKRVKSEWHLKSQSVTEGHNFPCGWHFLPSINLFLVQWV